jgi:hypothetical protein
MVKEKMLSLLKDYNQQDVEKYVNYLVRLENEKDKKTGLSKNNWLKKKPEEELADLFKRVFKEGLLFDGEHITLQSTGISYDYIAYKNKMLIAYPESQIDVGLVYKNDKFELSKDSGDVVYKHEITDPFNRKEVDIMGGYCIIKNKRGANITLLSREDIDKHRKVAKTDYIWREWFVEMALKTVVKKACKQHYADIYSEIEGMDNDNYNLNNPLDLEIEIKNEIDGCKDLASLKAVYEKHKGKGASFNKYITQKKVEINEGL